MTRILLEQVADANAKRIGEEHLSNLLGGAGLFDRQTGTKKERDKRPDQQYHQTHHDVLRNRQFGILRRDVQRVEQGQNQRPQKMIDQPGYA